MLFVSRAITCHAHMVTTDASRIIAASRIKGKALSQAKRMILEGIPGFLQLCQDLNPHFCQVIIGVFNRLAILTAPIELEDLLEVFIVFTKQNFS